MQSSLNISPKLTSTRTSAGCDIHVEMFPVNMVETSLTFQNTQRLSQGSSKGSESEHDSMQLESGTDSTQEMSEEFESLSTSEESISSHKTSSIRKKKRACLPPDLVVFLGYFGLKSENIRQTVIRRFKHTMKKVIELVYKYLKSPTSKDFERTIRNLDKLYYVTSLDRDLTAQVLKDILELVDGLDVKVFDATINKKSCNDAYIEDLFADYKVEELYVQHLKMAGRGELYFKTFQQFKNRELNADDKQLVFEYCGKIIRRNF